MKNRTALNILIVLIIVLAGFAAGMGLFYDTPGEPYALTTFRGEKVMINGHGLYAYDTVSSVAQMQANDLITLVLGLPLLVVSAWLANRGSLRGRLLESGTLGFVLYTYMSMAFATAFNALFLVYVILFSLSMYAFILSMLTYDLKTLPQQFSEKLPRKLIAGLMFFTALFLSFAWIGGRILPPLTQNTAPALDNLTTMVIQAMDLGMITPLAVVSGILLLRRSAWGYLLSSVAVMKFLTMGVAVSTMAINMVLQGVPDNTVLIVIFITITVINLVLSVLLMKNIKQQAA